LSDTKRKIKKENKTSGRHSLCYASLGYDKGIMNNGREVWSRCKVSKCRIQERSRHEHGKFVWKNTTSDRMEWDEWPLMRFEHAEKEQLIRFMVFLVSSSSIAVPECQPRSGFEVREKQGREG